MLVLLIAGLAPLSVLTGVTLPGITGGLQAIVEAEAGADLERAATLLRQRMDRLQLASLAAAEEAGRTWQLLDPAGGTNDGRQAAAAERLASVVGRWYPEPEHLLALSVRTLAGRELVAFAGGGGPGAPPWVRAVASAKDVRVLSSGKPGAAELVIIDSDETSETGTFQVVSTIRDGSGRPLGEAVLTVDANAATQSHSDFALALPSGPYLIRPPALAESLTDSVLADFPALRGAVTEQAPVALPTAGGHALWLPVPLDTRTDSTMWLGSFVPDNAGGDWVDWYLHSAASVAAMLLLPAFLVAWLASNRTRQFHAAMLDRLERALIRHERVGFHWRGTKEVRHFTQSLTELNERYIQGESVRKLEERDLREQLAECEQKLGELGEAAEQSQSRLDGLPVALMQVDLDGRISYCNQAAAEALAYDSPEALLNRSFHDTLQSTKPDGSLRSVDDSAVLRSLKLGRGAYVAEDVMARAKGSLTPVELHVEPVLRNSELSGVLVAFHDITLRKRAETISRREKDQLQHTLESITDGVITTDCQGRVQFLNSAAEKMLGWALADAKGLLLWEVYLVVSDSPEDPHSRITPNLVAKEGLISAPEEPVRHRSGEIVYAQRDALPIRDSNGQTLGMMLVLRDVTEDREREQQLRYQATHDPLTRLVNRYELEQRLERVIKSIPAYPGEHALCVLDLDQFKLVNDTCGHAAGDELLRQLAKALKSHVRQRDTFARLGGDEFAILLEYCPLHRALVLIERLIAEVRSFHFAWEEKAFNVGISIGAVMLVPEILDSATAIGLADRACYRAKQAGGNRIHVHQPNDSDELQRREDAQWAARITKALQDNRFRLYFQPIVPAERGHHSPDQSQIEIFVRMVEENGEMIWPDSFLPPAERHKLSRGIDHWVLHNVLEWAVEQQHESAPEMVHVNLSGQTLTDAATPDFLRKLIREIGMLPERICLDIKESSAVLDPDSTNEFVRIVRKMGFRVALGQCGRAHASPGFLKNLEVDYFKIHGELIRRVADDNVDFEIAKSIVSVGHALNRKVIAEWVENDAVLRAVRRLEADYAQGNGIAKPKPLEFLDQSS